MKKTIAILLALTVLASAFAQGSTEAPKTTETTAKGPSSISVCIASEPDTIDPALNSAVDGATLTAHLFSGLAKWDQDASGNLVIVADAATSLPEGVENADGTVTYTYTIRDMKWSDGNRNISRRFDFYSEI